LIWLSLLLVQTVADPEVLQRGEVIFAQSCATGYCHGAAGAAGRGPRLRGRSLDRNRVSEAIRDGIPESAMPGWKDRLAEQDLSAVIAYVMSLEYANEAELPEYPMPPGAGPAAYVDFPGPEEAKKGRDLFFDATRGLHCATCHSAGGRGIAVGPDLVSPMAADQEHFLSLVRASRSQHVVTATLENRSVFPALRFEQDEVWIKLYDLTSAPPVLRTFEPATIVSLVNTQNWPHQSVARDYKDEEIKTIVRYLNWLRSQE
jgi:mono/diheme cytochrome c family protein